jgi:heavy metal sensor kinase
MRPFKTLRVRFALWIAALLLGVLLAFGAFVYFSLAQNLAASIDDSLRLSSSQALAAVNIENGQINFSDSLPEITSDDLSDRGMTIRILNVAGEIVQAVGPYRALPVATDSLLAAQRQTSLFATLADPATQVRVRFYTAPIVENGQLIGIVQVAQSLDSMRATLDQLLAALLIGVPALIVLAALGGYFLAARALAPIDHITRTARRIADGNTSLSTRLDLPPTDDEVGRLATTFDIMLAQLDAAFQRERRFTADASHELRTPLAAMQAILGVIRERRRTPEDYEQALADISEEADRLRSLIEDLLRLARNDAQPPSAYAAINLSTLLDDVADSLRPLAEAKGLTLTCDIPSNMTIIGDGDELIRLFVNVLDNAVKYTERGAITIAARVDDDQVRVTITDTGIGIAAEQLPHIFERFYRVDSARTSRGTGLGLAIAQDIVRAHNGSLEVASIIGSGTTVVLIFPR